MGNELGSALFMFATEARRLHVLNLGQSV